MKKLPPLIILLYLTGASGQSEIPDLSGSTWSCRVLENIGFTWNEDKWRLQAIKFDPENFEVGFENNNLAYFGGLGSSGQFSCKNPYNSFQVACATSYLDISFMLNTVTGEAALSNVGDSLMYNPSKKFMYLSTMQCAKL